jgi:hypothetical protein
VADTSPVTTMGVSQGLFVLDIAGGRVWPADRVYGDGAQLIDAALSAGFWKMRAKPDGGVVIAVPDLAQAELWGRPREAWRAAPARGASQDLFPYVELPSPLAFFAQGGPHPLPSFGVADREVLPFGDARDPRPPPRAAGTRRYYAPTDDGEYYDVDDLPRVPIAAAPELQAQFFNRWFDPQTMLPCGAGNVVWRNSAYIGTSSASGPQCARFIGAYIERAADGEVLHVLSHGVGAAHGIAQRGRLLALGGTVEGLNLSNKPDPGQRNCVSVWDAVAGDRLGDLCFATGEMKVSALLFSADARELYAFARNLPLAQLYVWDLPPAWSALGKE